MRRVAPYHRADAPATDSRSSFAYRTAVPDDALCLSVLATQVFLDTYATRGIGVDLARETTNVYSVGEFAKRLCDEGAEIIVVQSGEYLIGFADLSFNAVCPVPSVQGAEVLRLYVQAPFQRCGIGTHLMSLAEEKARARRCRHVWLTAWAGNERALKFYPSVGYRDVGSTQYVIEGKEYENRVFARSIAGPV